jgi:hypothetical protein
MSDPRRLVEEGDLGASLLSAALVLDAEEAHRRRVALIGVAASGAAVTAVSAAAKLVPKSVGAAILSKSLVVGVVVAIVSSGVAGALSLSRSSPTAATRPIAAPSGRALATTETELPRERTEISRVPIVSPLADGSVEPLLPASPQASTMDPPSIVVRAFPSPGASSGARAASMPLADAEIPKRPEPRSAAEPPPNLLADEVAALRQARSALSAGQPAAALAALDAHERRFPQGLLGIEAEVLRIEALSQSGNPSAASARAKRFIAVHPNTPYARRVEAIAGIAPKRDDRAKP